MLYDTDITEPERATSLATESQAEVSTSTMRAATTRILESPRFQASPAMRSFLEYVVEESIAGRASYLKAYLIAVDALDKPESFDAQTDPSVRVLAGRVRAALLEYYADQGANEIVRISIPRGGYRPNFESVSTVDTDERTGEPAIAKAAETAPTHTPSRFNIAALLVAIAVIAAGLAAYSLFQDAVEQRAGNTISIAVRDNSGPGIGEDETNRALKLLRDLRFALARNEAVTVLDHTNDDPSSDTDFSVNAALEKTAEGSRYSVELINSHTRGVVWAQSIPLTDANNVQGTDPIIKSVVRELNTRVFGESIRALEGRDPETLNARQLFVLATWIPVPAKATLEWEKQRVALARMALEKDPNLGPAHSVLSDKLAYLSAVDPPSNTPEALKESKTRGESALALSLGDAITVFNVAQGHWHSGRIGEGLRAYKRVLELDPNFALAGFFSNVTRFSCKPAPDSVLQEAIAFDKSLEPGNPIRWVTLTWLGWLHFNRDEYEEALEAKKEAAQIFQIPYTVMRHAAILNKLGRIDESAELLRSQKRNWPNLDPAHFSEVTMPRICQEFPGETKMVNYYRDLTTAMKGRLNE